MCPYFYLFVAFGIACRVISREMGTRLSALSVLVSIYLPVGRPTDNLWAAEDMCRAARGVGSHVPVNIGSVHGEVRGLYI